MPAEETAVYPTIVLGRGEVSTQVLQKLAKLLDVYRSPVRYVVALGTTDGSGYEALHQPSVHTSEPFASPLSRWMHAIRSEENLTAAREAGLSVGPPGGYLLVQILLVVDSANLPDVPSIVQELRQASAHAQEQLPVRLHLLILHPSHDLNTIRLPESPLAAGDRWLVPCATWLVGLIRSDGSSITCEQMVETLPYLLHAAVHTASSAGEHWFFRSPSHSPDAVLTLGFSFLVLPLAEIEQALTDKLTADTFQPLLEEPEEPSPLPQEVTPAEGSWWQTLLSKLPGLVSGGAGLTLSLLRQETPPIGKDPRRWLQESDEWDARWQQETLAKWREGLRQAAEDLLSVFQQKVHEEFSRYGRVLTGLVPLLRFLAQGMAKAVEGWSIFKLEMPKLPTESLQTARAQFETALQQLPETSWLVRWSLIAAVVGWLVLGLAGYAVYTSLALPLAWLVPIVVGLPVLIGAGIAWLHYHKRRREVQEAWQVYQKRLQEFHAAQMRLIALEVLRNAAEKVRGIVDQQVAHAESLTQRLTGMVTLRQAAALGLRIILPPWIKVAISAWKHLQPVAQELWRHRDLRELLRRRAEREGITTPEDWLKGMDYLASDLRDSLVHHWMTPQHRRLSYYLRQRFCSEDEMRQWLQQQMEDMGEQASCLLWRSAKPPLQSWQFVDVGLPSTHGSHDDGIILVPDMMGRVCVGEAWLQNGS